MRSTISVVRASNPEGVVDASQSLQAVIADLDGLVDDQRRQLTRLDDSWAGPTSEVATGAGRRDIAAQNVLRDRLEIIRAALSAGGRQLYALREQILATVSQASSLGGVVADDGSVLPAPAHPLMTQSVAGLYSIVLRQMLRAFDFVDEVIAAALYSQDYGAAAPDVQAVDFIVGGKAPLGPPEEDPGGAEQRRNQIAAFREVFGRGPRTSTEWTTASALDPHSYGAKYNDVPPSIVVGRIEPVPGQGIVKTGLFIPRDEVFNVPRNDVGDNRGFDPGFSPEETRVSIYVDYETGVVIARQNPSVDVDGNVRVVTPDVKVQQALNGALRIQYDAQNAYAPPGAELTGHSVRGDIAIVPGTLGQPARVDGVIGDYPSLEIYQEVPGKPTYTLALDAADSGNMYGPLTELPFSHEIGRGTAAFEPFESHAPQLPGGPRYTGDTVPYVPGQLDPNTPTALAPPDRIPDVVVVR